MRPPGLHRQDLRPSPRNKISRPCRELGRQSCGQLGENSPQQHGEAALRREVGQDLREKPLMRTRRRKKPEGYKCGGWREGPGGPPGLEALTQTGGNQGSQLTSFQDSEREAREEVMLGSRRESGGGRGEEEEGKKWEERGERERQRDRDRGERNRKRERETERDQQTGTHMHTRAPHTNQQKEKELAAERV